MEANASEMICAKGGVANVAGDAFCGSCGAFLGIATEEAGPPEVAAVGSPTSQAAISEIRVYCIPVTP